MDLQRIGDGALRARIPPNLPRHLLEEALRRTPGVIDVVVADETVGIYHASGRPPAFADVLAAFIAADTDDPRGAPLVLTIPVRYDGPDLAEVAAANGCSPEELAERHAAMTYAVRMVGFLPGFAYLVPNGPHDPIVAPRRATPRPRVSAGSLAIGGRYSAIYPFASPGGWNLIGTAEDFPMYDPECGPSLRVGDLVRFQMRS